jgi:hypothetical protein
MNQKKQSKGMSAALGIGLGAASSALGMIGQNARAKKQHERQKELMDLQNQQQERLNKQGHQMQYDMWKKTSYPGQMEMMKEAGLNPALMYGMSGGGGVTTGSQGGGSAASGSSHAPMDIGASLQAGLMSAQIEKLLAEKDKIKTETTTESGKMENMLASKGDIFRGQMADAYWQIQKSSGDKLIAEMNKINEEGMLLNKQNKITRETMNDVIEGARLEAIHKELQNQLTSENVNKTKEEIDVLVNSIYQRWTEIGIKGVDTLLKGVLGGGGVGAIQKLIASFKK